MAKSNVACERITQALTSEPVRVVHFSEAQKYSEILDDVEAACVLVEIGQNPESELDTIASLQSKGHPLPVIAVSNEWTVSVAVRAIKSGADDVCDLQTQVHDLRKMIHKAIATELPRHSDLRGAIPVAILEKLDAEEARIVHLILLGLTAKEIGSALDVSIRTYHYRKKAIFQKLGTLNRSDLIELIRTTSGRKTEWHSPHAVPNASRLHNRPAFLSQGLIAQ
jgi:two-component system, LuxR family, response regulator FixJ